MSSIGLITPTYWRDLDRCSLLCESVDRYVTSYSMHYLIVADDELPLFARFNGVRRVVLPASKFLPSWLKPLPPYIQYKARRYWWSLRALPVNGWHVQQLLKLSAVGILAETRHCILDSDVVFFRPFDLSAYRRPNPIPLYCSPRDIAADAPQHAEWIRSSHWLLGLPEPTFPADDFIGHVIFWDRDTVAALTERVERVTGLEWVEALCCAREISEYLLYGTFVRHDAASKAQHKATSRNLCASYWDCGALDEAGIRGMLGGADANYVALSAASFSATPIEAIRSALNGFAAREMSVA